MAPTSANIIDLVDIAYHEVKRAPPTPMHALGYEDDDLELGNFNNQQVAVDDIPDAHYEQQAPPNSPDISDRSNRGSVQIRSGLVSVAVVPQNVGLLRIIGIFLMFVATLVMPLLKTGGVVWIILHDMSQDSKCKGMDCAEPINQTNKVVYFTMACGFFACGAAHFMVGCFVFARWPVALPKLINPMKVFATFTGLEILIVTITFPTIHLTTAMSVACVGSIFVEFLALSNVLCYLTDCEIESGSDDDIIGNQSEEFELECQGNGVEMDEGSNTGEGRDQI